MAQQNRSVTYSSKVNSTQELQIKKDQAIVFPIEGDFTNEDYLKALIKYVNPNKILFASRMSNGRFCVYLDSKDTADKFINEFGEMEINNKVIKGRHLLNPVRKLLLSNVCPIIHHRKIEKLLIEKLGLKLASHMNYVKGSYSTSELQHVISFRRSVLYSADIDDVDIPDSIIVPHDEEEFRIFLTTDNNMTCFHCKKVKHLAKKCPTLTSNDTYPEVNRPSKRVLSSSESGSVVIVAPSDNCNEVIVDNDSAIAPMDQLPEKENSENERNKMQSSKKFKPSNTQAHFLSAVEIESVKDRIDKYNVSKKDKFPLSTDSFIELLSNVKNGENKIEITRQCTDDLNSLIEMIDDIHPLLSADSKCTITCYRKHLHKEVTTTIDNLSAVSARDSH